VGAQRAGVLCARADGDGVGESEQVGARCWLRTGGGAIAKLLRCVVAPAANRPRGEDGAGVLVAGRDRTNVAERRHGHRRAAVVGGAVSELAAVVVAPTGG